MIEKKCPECGCEYLFHDYKMAEVVCARCGLVIDEIPAIDYIPKFASELGLSDEIQAKAIEIIEKAKKQGLNSGKPNTLAVAALYVASDSHGEKILIKDITNITGVTGSSLRKRREELNQFLD